MKVTGMNLAIFLAAMRYEWRMSWRDQAAWSACAALLFAIGFALHNGAVRVAAQEAAIDAARSDEAQRLTSLRERLSELGEGQGREEPPPWSDPRNAIFVGGGSAATVAALPPSPLAFIATGQSDLYPSAIKVTSGSKDTFLFSDEIENPSHLATGSIDLAFVLVFLFPLAILALCYDLVSGERERGTLALTLASSRDPSRVLAGKLVVRAGLPIVATLAVALVGVVIYAGVAAVVSAGLAVLCATILCYGVLWALLAAAVNGLGQDSSRNALILMAAWVVVTLIIPAAINAVSNLAYPSASRAEMVLAARAATIDADRERDAALAGYADEHPDASAGEIKRGTNRERSWRRLAVQEAASARVESVMATHDTRLVHQHDLGNRLSFSSPALLMYRAIAEAAGTGEARYGAFLARIDSFHKIWREFFFGRARAGMPLAADDYDKFPKFPQTQEATKGSFRAFYLFALGVAPLASLLAWRGSRSILA